MFDRVPFEDGVAEERVSGEDVLLRLDYPAYFDLLAAPLPDGRSAILDALRRDRIIAPGKAGGFDITNLGAILLARNLGDFARLKRKRLRVIEYRGAGRTETLKEHEGTKGYASGFEELVDYIASVTPPPCRSDAHLLTLIHLTGLSAKSPIFRAHSALVAGTLPQHRVTKLAPRPASEAELSALFTDALRYW